MPRQLEWGQPLLVGSTIPLSHHSLGSPHQASFLVFACQFPGTTPNASPHWTLYSHCTLHWQHHGHGTGSHNISEGWMLLFSAECMPFAVATRGLAPTHRLHHLKVCIPPKYLQADLRDFPHFTPRSSHLPDCSPNYFSYFSVNFKFFMKVAIEKWEIYMYACMSPYPIMLR